ncbi:hypothetical protein V3595_27470 [Bacillus sp. CFBP9009]
MLSVKTRAFQERFTTFTDNHGAIGIEFLNCWKDKRTIYLQEFEEYRKMYLKNQLRMMLLEEFYFITLL